LIIEYLKSFHGWRVTRQSKDDENDSKCKQGKFFSLSSLRIFTREGWTSHQNETKLRRWYHPHWGLLQGRRDGQ